LRGIVLILLQIKQPLKGELQKHDMLLFKFQKTCQNVIF